MSQYRCKYVHPDGARCEAQPQTGKSLCFFHDPEQQEKRDAARRSGGVTRSQGSQSDAPLRLPENVPFIAVQTREEIAYALQLIVGWLLLGQLDPKVANGLIFALSVASANLAAKERQEREAARAAERAAIREERRKEAAAREACTREAIERRIEAAVERAVREALAKAGVQPATEGRSAAAVKGASGVVEGAPSDGALAPATAPEEDVIIIDASKPLDLGQFGGKMPKFTSSQLEMTDIVTGDIHIVTSRGTTIIPGNKNKPDQKPQSPSQSEAPPSVAVTMVPLNHSDVPGTKNIPYFVPRREPVATSPTGTTALLGTTASTTSSAVSPSVLQASSTLAAPVEAPAEQSRECGTTENSPPFQRREKEIRDEEFRSAEGTRVAERSATHKTEEPETREGETANNEDRENARPKKDPNNPPKIPLRLQGRRIPPGCKLHPMIEYWGLH